MYVYSYSTSVSLICSHALICAQAFGHTVANILPPIPTPALLEVGFIVMRDLPQLLNMAWHLTPSDHCHYRLCSVENLLQVIVTVYWILNLSVLVLLRVTHLCRQTKHLAICRVCIHTQWCGVFAVGQWGNHAKLTEKGRQWHSCLVYILITHAQAHIPI